MRIGALFSGGKDSSYAVWKAMQENKVVCLITLLSENKYSYMFHTPAIGLTELQAEAMDLPLITRTTKGEKELELEDLKNVIIEAKEKHRLEGIVTGAVESVYQATRIQRICDELGLKCFNPLWKKDQEQFLEQLVSEGFEVMITGIAAYPLGKEWLGKVLDAEVIDELKELRTKFSISPTGEGGELETSVLDAPFFKKRINVIDSEPVMEGDNTGRLVIRKAVLARKN